MSGVTFRRTEGHTPDSPEYEVLLDGEKLGVVYRRTGTSAGYYGAWAARTGGPWGSSRADVAAALVARRARRQQS